MDASHELVILSQARPRCAQLVVAGCTAHCHGDYSEFRRSGLRPGAFILKSEDPAYLRQTLQQLRRDPDHATALAFIDGAGDEIDLAASDGKLPATSQVLLEHLEQWHSRARAIHGRNDNRGPDAMLLEYMWLRPDFVLEPLAQWQHTRRYRYPVLEALDRSDSDPDTWLQRLDKAGLIERAALRDRQRECDYCSSAHLGFIDVCPNCRSIEIDQHTALHCFTCGLIAPEQRFMRGDQRQCPKCGTRLRHIGSDYDRPLETNVCSSCDHVFVEGDVEARCAVCRHSMPTTRLRLRKIHAWRLSSAGCLAAQGDAPGQAQALFEPRQYLPWPHFLGSLEWSLKMTGHGSTAGFAVAALHLENLEQLNHALGVGRTADLLEACAERLRESLAEVDLAVRADLETIFLLLPGADRKRLAALHRTLQQLAAQAMQENAAGPSWRLAEHTLTARNVRDEDARGLLQRLRASLRGEDADRRVA
ncbi:MAG: diguanylate cyclase [Nevskia sp.]|nr:diguanylate cyclase [Nevskia sp.]